MKRKTKRCQSEGFKGDARTSIDLPKPEEDLLEAVATAGKPVVLELANGSALAVNRAKEHVNFPNVPGAPLRRVELLPMLRTKGENRTQRKRSSGHSILERKVTFTASFRTSFHLQPAVPRQNQLTSLGPAETPRGLVQRMSAQ